MHTVNGELPIIVCLLACLVSSSFSQNRARGCSSDWKAVFQSRLPYVRSQKLERSRRLSLPGLCLPGYRNYSRQVLASARTYL